MQDKRASWFDTVSIKITAMTKSEQSYSKTSKQGKKYFLDTADLRLPPPVLYVSDFERHAQRKNKVIQANYDDELLKIGIDRRVSRKFLTSDVRRFCYQVSSSKKLIPDRSTSIEQRSAPEIGKVCNSPQNESSYARDKMPKKTVWKRSPKASITLKEAWGVNRARDMNKATNKPRQAMQESVFITTTQESVTGNKLRTLPQSAKLCRNMLANSRENPRRPKTTTPGARQVRFWDEVDLTMEKENANKVEFKRKKLTLSGQSKQQAKTVDNENNIKPLSEIQKDFLRAQDVSKKADSPKIPEINLHQNLANTHLSSFLHFDKLQASCQLRRELRSNAENRKFVRHRRRLSEILHLEKLSYTESLSKMSTRLRNEELLNFCRESRRGLDNVFNYNL